mmetsp:Transcript_3105/g.6369  ORF Transcript_3105/g.6369 Transcript_3105/m.6369 type:complete len:344 (+) Transcript_3105:598-1629(+)
MLSLAVPQICALEPSTRIKPRCITENVHFMHPSVRRLHPLRNQTIDRNSHEIHVRPVERLQILVVYEQPPTPRRIVGSQLFDRFRVPHVLPQEPLPHPPHVPVPVRGKEAGRRVKKLALQVNDHSPKCVQNRENGEQKLERLRVQKPPVLLPEDPVRTPLEHHHLLGLLGNLRNHLDSRSPRSQNAHLQTLYIRPGIPRLAVELRSFEILSAWQFRCDRNVKTPHAHRQEICPDCLSGREAAHPRARVFFPLGLLEPRLKQEVPPDFELVHHRLQVMLDLDRPCVEGFPVVLGGERERIEDRGNVTLTPWVAVLPPSTPDTCTLVDDKKVYSGLLQLHCQTYA